MLLILRSKNKENWWVWIISSLQIPNIGTSFDIENNTHTNYDTDTEWVINVALNRKIS